MNVLAMIDVLTWPEFEACKIVAIVIVVVVGDSFNPSIVSVAWVVHVSAVNLKRNDKKQRVSIRAEYFKQTLFTREIETNMTLPNGNIAERFIVLYSATLWTAT